MKQIFLECTPIANDDLFSTYEIRACLYGSVCDARFDTRKVRIYKRKYRLSPDMGGVYRVEVLNSPVTMWAYIDDDVPFPTHESALNFARAHAKAGAAQGTLYPTDVSRSEIVPCERMIPC